MRQRIVGYYSFFFWYAPENVMAAEATAANLESWRIDAILRKQSI